MIEYCVDLGSPLDRHAHLYKVTATFPIANEASVDLRLPVWSPGSYLIREYARHVQDLTCTDEAGKPLAIEKIDKSGWRVTSRGAKKVIVHYRVYAYELTVRTSHLDDSHAFWNGVSTYLYIESLRAMPARVTVIAPPTWKIAVALDRDEPADPKGPPTFRAENYDVLADSPFHVGTHELIEFTAQGRPHQIAVWGKCEAPREAIITDFTKIIDTHAAMFNPGKGGVPYPSYTFILLLAPNGYGGLEHARSCTLLSSPFTFKPRKRYEEFLELVSHEYFHLWNVKRIHPDVLGQFDYQKEAYTRSLWVMEGVTSYYDRHALLRSGLMSVSNYLDKLGEEIGKIASIPGRRKQSLEESSFDAWVKLYRPDENTVNSTISYYLKGGMVALLLDLEIRRQTGDARSLDDVMRLLWNEHGQSGVGFRDRDFAALVERATGTSLGAFFDHTVRGREDLDPQALLASIGLELESGYKDDSDGDGPAWSGASFKESGGRPVVSEALSRGPAESSGLYAGDELIALDGFRVNLESLKERIKLKEVGQTVKLTLFRRDELFEVELVLDRAPKDKFTVKPVSAPSEVQKAAFGSWSGQDLQVEET